MKQFFATIEHAPLYYEARSSPNTLSLLGALALQANENVGEVHSFRSSGLRMFCETKPPMSLFAVTDTNEPQHFIAQQLSFLHDLLYLRLGAGSMNTQKACISSPTTLEKLRRTVAYYVALCDSLPSFLVHELEWLDLKDLRVPVQSVAVDVLKRIRGAAHVLIMVHAKVAVYERSADAPPLTPGEQLLFVVYGCAALGISASGDESETSGSSAPPRPVLDSVYLNRGTAHHLLLLHQLAPEIGLVVLVGDAAPTDRAGMERLHSEGVAVAARAALALEPYRGFLGFKSARHLPLHYFVEALPGLVHFVHVNRTAHAVRAPLFDPLGGTVSDLRPAVRDLLLTAMEHMRAHPCGALRLGPHLYTWRRWCEDGTGAELPPDAPAARVARRCELYALWHGAVGVVAADALCARLLSRLRELDS